jgi:selenocysteine-specific elongation factor
MRVIGTAGHVDHGKSTLVEALTGTHPDRLKEEREREMTIDLGFAWMSLPGGEEIGIVDVPGHRDFIENMLAGVAGIDAALFVIAADEGVMPQTREHLAILNLLEVRSGVVALTKVDLLDDPEWIGLVEEDIHRVLAGTVLEEAAIIRVSGKKKTGLDELKSAIRACLADQPQRANSGKPRLPIDRVFTIAGFGTVVTGTLSDGSFHIGDEVAVLPGGTKGRIRGLQTHKRKEEEAIPGSRTAINLSAVDVHQVKRGDVIAYPKDYRPTNRIDVRLRSLPDSSTTLHHNTQVKLFIGAAEVVARLRLIGLEEMSPGTVGWAQLETSHPIIAARGDHYILRRPSPGETLGGGTVLDPYPKRRHKRFAADTIQHLEALEKGTPGEFFLQILTMMGVAQVKDVSARAEMDEDTARRVIIDLVASDLIVVVEEKAREGMSVTPESLLATRSSWDLSTGRALKEVEDYHRSNPLRRGMPREELKSRLKLPTRIFNAILYKLSLDGRVSETGPWVMLPGHTIQFTPGQTLAIEQIMGRFRSAPYSPPTVKECQSELGEDVYQALIDAGRLVPVASDVVFGKDGYDVMLGETRRLLEEKGTVTAAQVRDHFNTSRRYALAFLEHLDERGVTIRDGDYRRLRQ